MIYGDIHGLSRPLPRIILGTLLLSNTDTETFSFLDSVHQMGGYALDTAHAYGDGASARVIGNWMEARGNRSEVIVIDKGAHPLEGKNRVNPESIRHDLAESLSRLRTDYIDLYLLHRDDPAMPVGPIVEVLNDLKNEGKIALFGASNWTHRRLEEANRYAEENSLASFAVSSCQYSLAVQYDDPYPGTVSLTSSTDAPERPWYAQTQYPLLAWSPLARGFFSGKFTRGNLEAFTDPQSLISIRCYARDDNFVRLDRARQLAREKGKTLPQIALAYIFHQPINCFAISGALTANQFKENVEALDMNLTAEEVSWLDLKSDFPG
ncbi:MAG: aldo/keto reductase [Phycisphaerae bacterium]|jgi:aryl-alcohol dehydrogenase-like predicted oxidoreductase|nr:aldo/keto reductase [Phycisphaerae bacterium]